jgi:hypothetical protein
MIVTVTLSSIASRVFSNPKSFYLLSSRQSGKDQEAAEKECEIIGTNRKEDVQDRTCTHR